MATATVILVDVVPVGELALVMQPVIVALVSELIEAEVVTI